MRFDCHNQKGGVLLAMVLLLFVLGVGFAIISRMIAAETHAVMREKRATIIEILTNRIERTFSCHASYLKNGRCGTNKNVPAYDLLYQRIINKPNSTYRLSGDNVSLRAICSDQNNRISTYRFYVRQSDDPWRMFWQTNCEHTPYLNPVNSSNPF